jgi:hypothetical protein
MEAIAIALALIAIALALAARLSPPSRGSCATWAPRREDGPSLKCPTCDSAIVDATSYHGQLYICGCGPRPSLSVAADGCPEPAYPERNR